MKDNFDLKKFITEGTLVKEMIDIQISGDQMETMEELAGKDNMDKLRDLGKSLDKKNKNDSIYDTEDMDIYENLSG